MHMNFAHDETLNERNDEDEPSHADVSIRGIWKIASMIRDTKNI